MKKTATRICGIEIRRGAKAESFRIILRPKAT